MMWMWMALAFAEPDKATTAEVRRVGEEMVAHAAAGRRQPLLRQYRTLLALTTEVDPELHMLAADAALAEGHVAEAVARYQRVPADAPQAATVRELLDGLAGRYGTVRLSASPGAELMAAVRFHPEEMAAVSHARDVVAETGVFVGLLPAGEYQLPDASFVVEAGDFVSSLPGSAPVAAPGTAPEPASTTPDPPPASEGEPDEDATEAESPDAGDG